MVKKNIIKKVLSLVIVCCFLSSLHIPQARAIEQEEEPLCEASGSPTFEELLEHLVLPEPSGNGACVNEDLLQNLHAAAADLPGLIVIYNIFMFIYYGRLCLETLDPAPCEAMVNHLVAALFLGILLESL